MSYILLQTPLLDVEKKQLFQEFPHLNYIEESDLSSINPSNLEEIEIFYGSHLSQKTAQKLTHLKWVHTPSSYLDEIHLPSLKERQNILLSNTREKNIHQIAEFVTASVMAFGKNLFYLNSDKKVDPKTIWNLEEKIFLQIGLGSIGSQIAKRIQQLNMRVWGVQTLKSFHPFCHKSYGIDEMRSLIPSCDVICLSLPRSGIYHNWFKKQDLELMKKDSILIIIGANNVIQERVLNDFLENNSLRAILWDRREPFLGSNRSEQYLITKELAKAPEKDERWGFKTFHYNLRQFLFGAFKEMKNRVDLTKIETL